MPGQRLRERGRSDSDFAAAARQRRQRVWAGRVLALLGAFLSLGSLLLWLYGANPLYLFYLVGGATTALLGLRISRRSRRASRPPSFPAQWRHLQGGYFQLYGGADRLLAAAGRPWPERLLWRLVRRHATRRLAHLEQTMPPEAAAAAARLKARILEAQVEAALHGHALAAWVPVDEDGWQARCAHCRQTVYVGGQPRHPVLDAQCPGGL